MRGPATGRKHLLYGIVVLLGLFAARVVIATESKKGHHRRHHHRAREHSPPTSPVESPSASNLTCPGDNAHDSLAPDARADYVFEARVQAATLERDGSIGVCQASNETLDDDGSVLLWSKFHKTLPHDALGQVDPDAFAALENCVTDGDFETCEGVPAGEPTGYLVNPLGGMVVSMAGPASSAISMKPAPTADSPEVAAQLAECYWMALARDVPFSQYASSHITNIASVNLAAMPGFLSKEYAVASTPHGYIDPLKHLFRASFVGVDKGPMITQLLVKNYTMDSITISPKATTFAPGVDYMTDYESWLHIQNGGAPDGPEEVDGTERYIRTARDLSRLVFTDTIVTEAFRAALILLEHGAIDDNGFNGPYNTSSRQQGFVQHGRSALIRSLGAAEGAQRVSWYQKWRVHLYARPEALGGVLHNTLVGNMTSTLHASLLDNHELLSRVAYSNSMQNEDGEATYLLPMAVKEGSPAHPSYPAGHAVQNGAFATVLKSFVGLERGKTCFPDPVAAHDDGLTYGPYIPTWDEVCIGLDGTETTGLTFEGEINKLATNVALGRSMMGVHYRFDSTDGMLLGETYAVRMLQQDASFLPEQYPYEFRLFRGDVIKLYGNTSFSINDCMCDGPVYSGVENC